MSAPAPDAAGAARRERRGLLLRSPTVMTGAAIILFWVVCALAGPQLVPYDPYATDILGALAPPSARHWFGTDQLGRDVFSRVVVGARDILVVAPLATALGVAGGVVLGLVTGYYRGAVDNGLSRLVDVLLTLPLVIIALLALAAIGASTATVVVVIGVVFTPLVARTVRAAVLSQAALDYVAAARLRGERGPYILFVEILPNVAGPILVEATVRLGYAVFTVATLSFIGFGIQPPSPDWGLAISENYGLIGGGIWWIVLANAAAVASLVVGVNLVADGVQEALAT
ncbi:MAG TPA: ABC transporter permease [Caulobacteraceae bacterium]|nr:ABC transporter permease [Caulobacteraceae bacterium]